MKIIALLLLLVALTNCLLDISNFS